MFGTHSSYLPLEAEVGRVLEMRPYGFRDWSARFSVDVPSGSHLEVRGLDARNRRELELDAEIESVEFCDDGRGFGFIFTLDTVQGRDRKLIEWNRLGNLLEVEVIRIPPRIPTHLALA